MSRPARQTDLASTTAMCRQTGVTMSQASRWMHAGVVTPTLVEPVTNRGTCTFVARWDPRLFSAMRLVGQLAVNGAAARQLRGAFATLSSLGPREWNGKLYVSPAGHVTRRQMSPIAHVLDLDHSRPERRAAAEVA